MTVYIDTDYKCHVLAADGLVAVTDTFFANKCAEYIEGYRYVPAGETWTREDGVEFSGEMISPWRPWAELDAAQREYERQQIAQYESALSEIETALGVNA